MHPSTMFVCDEDATLELRVKTHKYFKGLMDMHKHLIDEYMEDEQTVPQSSS